jgi:hypothetical protein
MSVIALIASLMKTNKWTLQTQGKKKQEQCVWAGIHYTVGQTFRLPKCRVCSCKSGKVVQCHFDLDCRQVRFCLYWNCAAEGVVFWNFSVVLGQQLS